MKQEKPFLNSPRHRSRPSGLFSPDSPSLEKTNSAALFSALEFLTRAREERHRRRTALRLIGAHPGPASSPAPQTGAAVPGRLCLSFRQTPRPQGASCWLERNRHLPKTHARGAGPASSSGSTDTAGLLPGECEQHRAPCPRPVPWVSHLAQVTALLLGGSSCAPLYPP